MPKGTEGTKEHTPAPTSCWDSWCPAQELDWMILVAPSQLRIFHDPVIVKIIPTSHIWIQLRWEQRDKRTFVCPYLKTGSRGRGYWENPAGAGFFLWTPGLMAQSGLQKVETFSWAFQQLSTIKLNKTKYRKACKLAQALSTRKKIQEIITMDSGNEVQLLPYWNLNELAPKIRGRKKPKAFGISTIYA